MLQPRLYNIKRIGNNSNRVASKLVESLCKFCNKSQHLSVTTILRRLRNCEDALLRDPHRTLFPRSGSNLFRQRAGVCTFRKE
jgi:hypothetical protein